MAVVTITTPVKELSTLLLRAQETERRALERELHDEVGQFLIGYPDGNRKCRMRGSTN